MADSLALEEEEEEEEAVAIPEAGEQENETPSQEVETTEFYPPEGFVDEVCWFFVLFCHESSSVDVVCTFSPRVFRSLLVLCFSVRLSLRDHEKRCET